MDDMSDAPTAGMPSSYSDAGTSAATPSTTSAAEARPGLQPVTVGTGPLTIEREIPHISRLMANSIDEVLDHAEVVLIGNPAKEFGEIESKLNSDQIVVDLVRVVRVQHDPDRTPLGQEADQPIGDALRRRDRRARMDTAYGHLGQARSEVSAGQKQSQSGQ